MSNFVAGVVLRLTTYRFQTEDKLNNGRANFLTFRCIVARRERKGAAGIKATSRASSCCVQMFANRFRLFFHFRASGYLVGNGVAGCKAGYVFTIEDRLDGFSDFKGDYSR